MFLTIFSYSVTAILFYYVVVIGWDYWTATHTSVEEVLGQETDIDISDESATFQTVSVGRDTLAEDVRAASPSGTTDGDPEISCTGGIRCSDFVLAVQRMSSQEVDQYEGQMMFEIKEAA